MLNELTDLPDDAARIGELADLNARIRTFYDSPRDDGKRHILVVWPQGVILAGAD